MTWEIQQGDVIERLREMAAESVNCVVTSPPYWGLRDYGVKGQLGLEPTPEAYVCRMVEVFREVRRVLRPDGTLWLNLGDSYAGSGRGMNKDGSPNGGPKQATNAGSNLDFHDRLVDEGAVGRFWVKPPLGLKTKDLVGIPWRVAFALQADGWWLRSDIVWSKPNPMPESVTDRPTRSHEYVFLLTKSERYAYDAEAIREASTSPEQEAHNQRYAKTYAAYDERASWSGQPDNVNNVGIHSRPGPGGRNARSVWEIATEPFPDAHFATYPTELVRRCILAGCPEGGTVLDPFAGSGTTLMVALRYGRNAVGIELNPKYVDMAKARIIRDRGAECPDEMPPTLASAQGMLLMEVSK